jgi:TRAP-type C4-dicarboxylate transport system permease small subunit
MERLYLACIVVSAIALIAITLVIPYGVFWRYVMNSAASWPEPFSVLAMVVFSFIGGAAAYRAKAHIAVATFLNMMGDTNRRRTELMAELGMALVALFMIKWGVQLVRVLWHNSIAEFPGLSAGVTYIPIPVAGVVTLLFVIERVWLGLPPETSYTFRDQPQSE